MRICLVAALIPVDVAQVLVIVRILVAPALVVHVDLVLLVHLEAHLAVLEAMVNQVLGVLVPLMDQLQGRLLGLVVLVLDVLVALVTLDRGVLVVSGTQILDALVTLENQVRGQTVLVISTVPNLVVLGFLVIQAQIGLVAGLGPATLGKILARISFTFSEKRSMIVS